MGDKVSEDEEKKTLKVIFPKASAECIARQAQFRGKYIQVEPFNSFSLRDHVEANAKNYKSESVHSGNRSFSLQTLI